MDLGEPGYEIPVYGSVLIREGFEGQKALALALIAGHVFLAGQFIVSTQALTCLVSTGRS